MPDILLDDICRRHAVKMAPVLDSLPANGIPVRLLGMRYFVPGRFARRLKKVIDKTRAEERAKSTALRRLYSAEVKDPDLIDVVVESVYFIRCVDYVKIGFGFNVRQRLSRLQVGCPYDLEIMAEVKGGREVELKIHEKFRRFHHRGEWFKLAPQLEAHIKRLAGPPRKRSPQHKKNQPFITT